MKPFAQIKFSLKFLFESFTVLRRAKLRMVYLVPILLYLVFLIIGFSLTNGIHGTLMQWLQETIMDLAQEMPYLEALMTVTSVIFWILIKILLFIAIGAISGYLILIVLSPLLTWVSERVYIALGGSVPVFSLQRFLTDLKRALFIAVRNGLIQLVILIFFFILSFVPVVNVISAPLLFIASAYYYGFSFLDYANERAGYSVSKSVQEVRKLKWAAITLGSVFLFFSTLPWVGQLIAAVLVFHMITAATMLGRLMETGSEV